MTKDHAITVLEHLRDTGEVDWSVVDNAAEAERLTGDIFA